MTWTLPNKLTVLRMILVPFFVAALLIQNGEIFALRMTALVLFLIASLTDLLDGKIARKYNLVTNFGKFMDPLADKLLVCSALICLVQLGQLPAWIVIIIISREFIISGFKNGEPDDQHRAAHHQYQNTAAGRPHRYFRSCHDHSHSGLSA